MNSQLPSIKYMLKRIYEYSDRYSKKIGISKYKLFCDYWVSAIRYGCSGLDYFLYKFYELNDSQKKQFVTDAFESKYERLHTDENESKIITDKEKLLYSFENYIKRDWCGININNTEELYSKFSNTHEKAIVKPRFGMGGNGIKIIETQPDKEGYLFNFCHDNNLVVEELICQHDDLNKLFPNAVNTIRIATLNSKVIGATLRMGVGDSCVDNAHAGGIYAEIDIDSGRIVGDAMNNKDEHYSYHPTTKVKLNGTKIPFWNECLQIAIDASKVLPGISLIGFDIAVTNEGPVFVEANDHPGLFVIQAPNGNGLMRYYE